MKKNVYILEGLDCANCAARIEQKLSTLKGVEEVSITFATGQMRLTAEDPDALLDEVEKVIHKLEPDVKVVKKERRKRDALVDDHHDHHEHNHHDHDHDHGDSCCSHDRHDHDHGDSCCGHDHHDHDHDHGDSCCGHDHHDHDHDHGDSCCGHDHHDHEHEHGHHHHVPGHPADCDCELCHPHTEYCDVCGESLANCTCNMPDDGCVKKVFILEGLDCPNCAAKIEAKIRTLSEVEYASVTYANKQLRVSARSGEGLLNLIQTTIDSVEDGITVIERKRKVRSVSNTTIYILEGLDCANCAAKIEQKLRTLPEIDDAVVTFATKQLKVSAGNSGELTEFLQKTIDAIEDGVTVVKKDEVKAAAEKSEPKKEKMDPMKVSLIQIFAGAALFLVAEILEKAVPAVPHAVLNILLVAAYLVLGGKVLMTALRNIKKGQVFDENFLMSIATLGAFATNQIHEAVGVMLFYRIGEYFEQRATNQSRNQIMDAVDMRPEVVNLVVGDEIRVMEAEEANVGDILLVRPGDRIPLDGVVIEGESRIDTSPVTGEPVPVKAEFGDNVVSGCVNTSGVLKIRVEKVLEESMVTRILDSVENAAASKPQIDKFITRFSRIYTPFVVFMALAVAILPNLVNLILNTQLMGKEPVYWVTTALTFLVISCPCALVLSVPLAFFSGIGAGSKKGILFKGGVTIESLTNVKAVVMDKTGTITEGNFVVQQVVPFEGSGLNRDQLLSVAASCELSSTHPIGTSIVAAAQADQLVIERPSDMQEIAGKGIKAVLPCKTVLCGNRKLMKEFNVDLSEYRKEGFGTEVLVAVNGKFAGNIIIADTIKKEAGEAIAKTKAMGVVTAMLTGDAKDSAEAVAAETGIDEVHAKLLPQDKLEHLMSIRAKHGNVMFVGDGINDAPVLAGADVGAAMGSGADAAIEAADVVFMTSSMDAIPEAIDIARATSRISWQNVYFALAVKAVVMLLGLFGYANMWLAVFADTGVSMLCLLNSMRILYRK